MILLIGLVTKNSILLVEYTNQLAERGMDAVAALLESGRIRLRPILMTSVATIMGAVPIALGLGAGSMSRRPLGYAIVGGVLFSTAADALPGAGGVLADRTARVRVGGPPRGSAPSAAGGRGMIATAPGMGGGVAAGRTVPRRRHLPRITLAEALRRAARLDPNYVQALGAVDNAAWARRAAMIAMILPSISVGSDYTTFSTSQFNVGTGAPARTSATAADRRPVRAVQPAGASSPTLSQTKADLEAPGPPRSSSASSPRSTPRPISIPCSAIRSWWMSPGTGSAGPRSSWWWRGPG